MVVLQHLSNTKRKELKKQLRKQQANERKKGGPSCDEDLYPSSTEDSEVFIVKDIACLSI